MGALQEMFTTQSSNDIFHDTAYSKMIDYGTWNKYARENSAVAPGPVTIISLGKSEVDQVLNKLGVVQRGRSSVADSVSVDHSLCSGHIRRVPSVGAKIKKPKVGLQPKDLKVEDLQELIGEVEYQEVMEMYGFTSERYFKEVIKALGYRLLRSELWVIKDKLWLN